MAPKLPSTKRSLPIALIRAREAIMGPIREMLADTGVTEQQWRVLRVLAEYGPQDATEVSERACLLMPSLTRIVKRMSEVGLITREKDARDGRRQTLSLTAEGQALIDNNLTTAVSIIADIKARVGAEEYERLLDLLEAVAQSKDR
ncbi:homoprotocatechuate degradation operon regulator HpaR [Cognatishimia sp. SS12]|uniref:homoprotocatechuate degradation operon regulator HpaR n=1 Tax=Cognatishimia sp. SS12 TaxID=2979465 RepID=UPI0023306BBD|nr:homoprotocatechuate degradation operon regulator HpaR [Cognatishimia sp. SS12]MDC0739554.1 homoprotocatechuate degradation operon regulator HpaR [Cognatishimia sp. SS12]